MRWERSFSLSAVFIISIFQMQFSFHKGEHTMSTTTPIAGQAGRPHGFLGTLFGYSMAFLNEEMNQQVIDLLDVQPTDQVLEIGFGPGKTIQRLSQRATNGFVAGIDISETMLHQASRRNKERIRTGRVELHCASVSQIPYENNRFDKIGAVNTFQFWPHPEQDVKEVYRVLKPGGLFILAVRGRDPAAKADFNRLGFSETQIQEIASLLKQAGFLVSGPEIAKVRFMTAVCLMAQKDT
jgi:ubiquinone/menaquinone biosynthesis C-methylase UbiE